MFKLYDPRSDGPYCSQEPDFNCSYVKKKKIIKGCLCRLQQPVQNPIRDNTNVLWNSPSLGKNYSYRLPLYLLKGKKQGQTHLFFLV